ncbi:MAG: hypothetical protein WBP16_11735, partial [Ferruginibacter sp.]
YQDYQDLYNSYSNNDGFSALKEVLLAKYFSIPDFDKLISKFEFEVIRRNDEREIAIFKRLVQFLDKEDIEKWLK